MKRTIAAILGLLLFSNSICMAMPLPKKQETVYVNLDAYGEVAQMHIYSKWTTNGVETVEDHTKYLTVSNLTNRQEAVSSGDTRNWNVSGEKKFSYTGVVGEEYYDLLPWHFTISYQLNGVEVTPEELLGATRFD